MLSEQDNADRPAGTKPKILITSRIDPGPKAFVIAIVLLVLVVSSLLPWTAESAGWQVLTGQTDPSEDVGLLPHLFAINCTIVGLVFGALALMTRFWMLAFVAGLAGVVVAFEGMVAIWSRNTGGHTGPGIGLVLAVICMVVLAVQWIRILWTRDE
ncbi:hypothetical protein [Saccharopolyspora halophila]|uniref:Rv2732c family membrane protein n=1 Tax=Saccharopolyspora halophila TaxID=405551 RepID=UPI0031D61603